MKTSIAIDEYIAGRGHKVSEQPSHNRYIMTLFGSYGRPAGKAIPIAAIVELLAELNSEPSSVRSSISRLKKKGVLLSKKTKTGTTYSLPKDLEPYMQTGDERIFTPLSANVGDPWLLVSFSVPESKRKKRHKIRTGLDKMGFGVVTAGLYIAPIRLKKAATEYIREYQLWEYVDLFISEASVHMDIKNKVSKWWNLETLALEYQTFIDIYQPEINQWQNHLRNGTATTAAAFKLHVLMMTQWRGLPFLDPGLPPELLPINWEGTTARKVFNELHRLLKSLAEEHFNSVTNKLI